MEDPSCAHDSPPRDYRTETVMRFDPAIDVQADARAPSVLFIWETRLARTRWRPGSVLGVGMTELLVARAKECQHVPVGIRDFKAPEPVIDPRELLHE